MGSGIEINDTLQITTDQGFPSDILDLQKHLSNPIVNSDVANKLFLFSGKSGARIFQLEPVRVYLVHNINNKWLFWGHVFIQSQTISKIENANNKDKEISQSVIWQTSGTFIVSDIYEPEYQRLFTLRESPKGLSFF